MTRRTTTRRTMTRSMLTMPLAAALLIGATGAGFAFGGGGGGGGGNGSGLSPYAALQGNDRSAGVNNGNYRDPALDPYLRAYDPETAARYSAPPPEPRLRMRPYYGRPY